MSDYGLKIKNYEAGSLYGYNLGIRDRLDYTDAMLTNSLFSDFLKENGLNVWKGKSTRDIVCIEFNYGTRSYEEELSNVKSIIKRTSEDSTLLEEEKEQRLTELSKLVDLVESRQEKYKKASKEEIRSIFYTEGVDITYKTHNKRGQIIKEETIHYKMLFRTPGKAKKGSCMFINEKLYDIAHKFLYMGIDLPIENSPIVEMGAYSSLITSSIVGKVQILPEQILILKDIDAFFNTKVISVETDEHKHCVVKSIDDYRVKNTLFDGQALIDSSIFPEWGEGYVLLRHHLCKMAAFNTNIQIFMKDYFGDSYEEATVQDMFGNTLQVKDIKLITTDNAMKWLKFDIDFDYWSKWVRANNSMFGIVKTAHKSKLGEVQRMSYQMINALDIDIMDNVTQCSVDYIYQLKSNDEVFLNYLRDNKNYFNDFELLVALVEQDPDFVRSEYFRERRATIIQTYCLNMRSGKIIQNADNLVIVGSPYAMLLHSVGENALNDPTFVTEEDSIQCYTERFNINEYLAEFRSPFNSKNNMGHLHNVHHEYFAKYFNFGKQIIAVNMIGTPFQDRNNGSDQDSDSLYVTNQPDIVNYAKYCYIHYPTIVNNIPKQANKYSLSLDNYALIDNKLAAAQLAIGESSNLAQICLTYSYNFEDQKYKDYVCILSVLAQIAIDNAKRSFDIDLNEEIARIKKDMNIKKNGFPVFWQLIRPEFNTARINNSLNCPMNYLYNLKIPRHRNELPTIPNEMFLVKYGTPPNRRKSKKVEKLIEDYSLQHYLNYRTVHGARFEADEALDNYTWLYNNFMDLINEIKTVYISNHYLDLFSWLIDRTLLITNATKNNSTIIRENNVYKNRPLILSILYQVNSNSFLKCFSGNLNKAFNLHKLEIDKPKRKKLLKRQ